MAGLQRYRHIGRVYDILSLERVLYSKPRRHLHELIGPLPATSILDNNKPLDTNHPWAVPAGCVQPSSNTLVSTSPVEHR